MQQKNKDKYSVILLLQHFLVNNFLISCFMLLLNEYIQILQYTLVTSSYIDNLSQIINI